MIGDFEAYIRGWGIRRGDTAARRQAGFLLDPIQLQHPTDYFGLNNCSVQISWRIK